MLFVTATRIGDAVLSSGLLGHLLETRPDLRPTIACGPVPAPLFAAVPGVERVISMAKRRRGGHWLDLWRQAVGTRWDLVVDLRGSALAWLLPARRRVVFRDPGEPVHRVRLFADLLDLAEPPAPRLWLSQADQEAAAAAIPPGGPVLALAPTANWIAKVWPAENFAALAARLTGPDGILPGARVAVFGAEAERALAEPLLEALPKDRLLDLMGRLSLSGTAAALGRCALFVGNDSGLMHMAAAMDIPTIGLFGPSRDEFYAPWGWRARAVRTPEGYDGIFPPGFNHLATGSLMGSLAVDAVETACRGLWSELLTGPIGLGPAAEGPQ